MCVRVSTRGGWGGQSDAFDGEYEIRQGGGEEIIVSPTEPPTTQSFDLRFHLPDLSDYHTARENDTY